MISFDEIAEQSRASIQKEDLKILIPILAKIEPKNILEIGTWKGYSAETWYWAFQPDVLVSLEIEKGIMDVDWTKLTLNTQTIKLFEGCNSHNPDVVKTVGQVKYDFLFIDGDHSEQGVRKDFEMYSPLVRKGGIIVLHDVIYTSADPLAPVQVKPLWEELKLKYPYVEIKTKDSTGIGVIFI